ncbi:hypothetical protein RI570_06580 [Brucella pseudogrignonensis]|uniref:hypothetical protein n=1 Tax=Brucella pseudogrignonensis TaxID=419475 RepID=UPI0028B4955F|nr:hypothetical protein [Brucella pseudogrignonensis]MDT6939809.1 hypothetical protein [Brucella pseudogrignonensis]
MTSNLHNEIHDHFSLFTNLYGKEDNLAFVHAISEFYPGDVTPVGGLYGAAGHWWLEANGEIIDPFNYGSEWPHDANKRGIKELEKAINHHVFSENIYEHSADILSIIIADQDNAFSFESKIGENDDFDEDFEDGFDFADDEPQGLRP